MVVGPDVAEMPHAQLRPVFIHELAHVKRGDFLINLLTTLALMFFWPNPLMWWARRRASLEQEQACDDEVLNRGVRSPVYAGILLDFAVGRPSLTRAIVSRVGFLRFSPTKRRIHSILEAGLDRRPLGFAAGMLAAVLILLLVTPVGSVKAMASEPGTGTTSELITALSHPDADVRTRAARTLGRRNPGAVQVELEALLVPWRLWRPSRGRRGSTPSYLGAGGLSALRFSLTSSVRAA